MNYDNNKKFGLLQFYSGHGHFYLNSPKGFCRKKINAQTGPNRSELLAGVQFFLLLYQGKMICKLIKTCLVLLKKSETFKSYLWDISSIITSPRNQRST